jgi:NAD(P)-dependent dehydrogenase (short-subunit alcohol dehydrogenase family)
MVANKTPGSIVTIASIAAHGAIPGQTVSIYGASKAAVKLMTRTLAVEMAPHGIRINSISPGFVYTEMSKQFPHLQPLFNSAPPAGRIGQREDMSLAVAYLLSPQGADYTTGADIPITGGLHAGRIQV